MSAQQSENTPQTKRTKIVLAKGDGIGPEIADATLQIIKAAGVDLDIQEVLVGEKAFEAGYETGIEPGAMDAVKQARIMLKAPMNTPSGGGFKSLNVTMRQELGLWANIRPAVSYPYHASPRDDVHVTVFRENTEGMYVGLTKDMSASDQQSLDHMFGQSFTDLGFEADGTVSFGVQIISDEAAGRIANAAFNYAAENGSAEVHGMSKPNILKATDGRFKQRFEDAANAHSGVSSRFSIIDAGFGNTAAYPVDKGVIVTQNLYGDVLSDVMAFQAHGSLGLAPSVNLGGTQDEPIAMFEAVHGTAPDIAGQGIANPSAFLLSALMMLKFIGHDQEAQTIHDALMKTWEDGTATGDIRLLGKDGKVTRGSLGTQDFAKAVIGNLGQKPSEEFVPNYMTDSLRAALPKP